jgi:D-alanyl-D-alanine carboxypeptidase
MVSFFKVDRDLAGALPLLFGATLPGCAAGAFDGQTYAELTEQAVAAGLPGVALYVSTPEETFDGAAGEAVLGESPYVPEDRFRIASNSKSFLGVVAAKLSAEGLLDLDTKLADHVPASLISQIENADKATLRQALTHTSGIYDYLEDDGFWAEVDAGRTTAWTAEEALAYAYGGKASFAVGTDWEYSNSNYLLAGLAIDEIAGRHHAVEIRERILDPLGMSGTYYEIEEPATGRLVHGYTYYFQKADLDDTAELQQGYGLADGGIVATAGDLGTYIRAVAEGSGLLTDEERELLFGSAVSTGEGDTYGLGVSVFPGAHGDSVGHGGALEGYLSEMYHYPDSNVTIVAFTNTTDGYFKDSPEAEDVFGEFLTAVEGLAF